MFTLGPMKRDGDTYTMTVTAYQRIRDVGDGWYAVDLMAAPDAKEGHTVEVKPLMKYDGGMFVQLRDGTITTIGAAPPSGEKEAR